MYFLCIFNVNYPMWSAFLLAVRIDLVLSSSEITQNTYQVPVKMLVIFFK